MGERGRRRVIDEWNYETTFVPVMRRVLAGVAQTVSESQNLGTSEPRNPGTPEPSQEALPSAGR
jgi:hypothetical protein